MWGRQLVRWLFLSHAGMLVAGFLIRNIPFTSSIVKIKVQWGAVLRNIALSIILALAGLGLNPEVEYRMILNQYVILHCLVLF